MHRLTRRGFLTSGLASGLAYLPAQTRGEIGSIDIWRPGEATALCIGCANYQNGEDLVTPLNDARVVGHVLNSFGYEVKVALDPTQKDILTSLATLRLRSKNAKISVIFFAGHGVSVNGDLQTLATDVGASQTALSQGVVSEDLYVASISDAPRKKIVLLDACRVSSFSGSVFEPAEKSGQSSPPTANSITCYSAQLGAPSFDGDGPIGPFVRAFTSNISSAILPVEHFMKKVRLDVIKQTSGLQVPWSKSSLLSDVSIARAEAA